MLTLGGVSNIEEYNAGAVQMVSPTKASSWLIAFAISAARDWEFEYVCWIRSLFVSLMTLSFKEYSSV